MRPPRTPVAQHIYSSIWTLALPLVLARLWWKGRKQPEYRQHLGERFGRYAAEHLDRSLWLHAVSVGETRAAAPLVRALRERYQDVPLIITHMTPTGRATGEALYGAADPMIRSAYLPYDLSWLHRRFFRHFSPRVGIIMETEVWPNLLAASEEKALPVCLVNARLSERSAKRYETMGSIARAAFARFTRIGAQAPADAARLEALGSHAVTVTGNIKFDNQPQPDQIQRGLSFRKYIGERQVVLAASTREGEEAPLLDAAAPLIAAGVLLVIVPRHPQRFDDVSELAVKAGYRVGRRSQSDGPAPDEQIWIGDSMGEMTAYYTLADLTLMGGTWLPLGGQNFIECCAVGTPVLLGPSVFNFAQAAEQALACGAAHRCEGLTSAIELATRLLSAPEELRAMSTAGCAFASAHGGATERTMAMLCPIIDAALEPSK
ncbi:lipid IV(A) 3-deoxy-D-manno-octulosonic acid transferase [Nitrogeniibacter aestuarii]|uniref:lipid IV(A) 3-deoxy-D-manno-octulosonic acid transferase n=1 Tax=Nitrogeniibacter aestuarii TaxID=2815343 RepID=UPI001D11D054|nr:lipid IV(A) 3-deoxy-D-manno-octulosonic acid transferase [Nitrogeniibacter aestuarii]